jgi:hypothetical protein
MNFRRSTLVAVCCFFIASTSILALFTNVVEVHRLLRDPVLPPLPPLDDRRTNVVTPPPPDDDDDDDDDDDRVEGEGPRRSTLLAEILRGRVPFPVGVDRLRYRPGSGLRMDVNEAFRYCRVGPEQRTDHVRGGAYNGGNKTFVSMSEHHGLIYRNVPKSASRRVYRMFIYTYI